MKAVSVKLPDRTLWFDGSSSYDPSTIMTTCHNVEYVDYMTDDVLAYNDMCASSATLSVKSDCEVPEPEWNLPEEYQTMTAEQIAMIVFDEHDDRMSSRFLSERELQLREDRLQQELIMYQEAGLLDIIRTILYVINTFLSKGVVWGVGRGSSVSSYVLYAIGVHDVDSYAYDLPITDFLHD